MINKYLYIYTMCRKSTVFYHFAGQPHGYQTSMDPCTEDTRWSTGFLFLVVERTRCRPEVVGLVFMVGPGVVIKSGEPGNHH